MEDLLGRLKDAVQHMHDGKVSVGFLADIHGKSAHGALLVFLSVLTILPIPGSGFVFSMGIFAVAWMMWKDDDSHGLPEMVCKVEIPASAARKMIKTLTWIYDKAHRLSRERLIHLASSANKVWMVPFILVMGFIIFLPIPFGNGTPATALILVGLGLMARDGIAIVLGLLTGLAAVGVLIFLIYSAVWLIQA